MSVDIPKHTQVNLSIADGISLVKTNTVFDFVDTICKDELIYFKNNRDYISVISLFPTNAIYWSGFHLDALFDPLITFNVARTRCTEQNPIVLDMVRYNIDGAWKTNSNKFVASRDGLYYFSVNIEISAGPVYKIAVMHNENGVCQMGNGMAYNLISKYEFDFMSKSCFIEMKAGDQIELWYTEGIRCTQASNELISLSGFNYSPKNKLQVK